jgi:integrase/recombinase XerD
MANRVVALMLRANTLPKRPYLKPHTTANGTVRPLWAMHEGKPTHFPTGVYYLRFKQGPKLVFERIGPHLDEALAQLARKRNLLEGVILGNQPAPVVKPKVETTIESAIETYLSQVGAANSQRTAVSYRYTLEHFRKFLEGRGRLTVEAIDTADMVAYVEHMQREGSVERTQFNRLQSLHSFLTVFGRDKLYPRKLWPRFTEKEPDAFTRDELVRLFEAADPEDRLVFQFFLSTGLREGEVAHATWQNLSFQNKLYTVRENRGRNFQPKSRRERSIPLPDDLLAALWERRQANPTAQLIFPNGQGEVEGHFLRRLKSLAWGASLNCGECQDDKGWSCVDHPNCSRWQLHTFRRSFATLSHQSGVSARDIQKWLGHSDLQTTERYLRASANSSPVVRDAVNRTFNGLNPARPKLVA